MILLISSILNNNNLYTVVVQDQDGHNINCLFLNNFFFIFSYLLTVSLLHQQNLLITTADNSGTFSRQKETDSH